MNRLAYIDIQRRFAGEDYWQDVEDIVADLATNNYCCNEYRYRVDNESFDFAKVLIARERVDFMFCSYRIKPLQKENLLDEALREHIS